ncbi:NAD(P)/FAD-dependent oxidoreductase [Undibacterium curvum]|jgi:gamma-glutamylputrescine oxidase|uniref:FAD-binding oxidoreductase n=1 Tax=Undibacterium curvum TaxID=2762294 RepID=A0ABR7A0G8_9BURK|nr:FAD-binding oxidoreductase [Undibacterium curvum]MBC3930392.1 FAD-binding oxidoreductase [Undibacterium curvum]
MLLSKEAQLTENSYYEASVTRPGPAPALREPIRVDVCVIGAGFAGLSAALELRAKGYTVAVLEAKTAGWGASGRNGGQAIVGYASDDAIEAQFSAEDARQAWQITVEALQLLRSRIAQHAISCDFVPGFLNLAINAKKGRELAQASDNIRQRYNYPLQSISPAEIGNWIDSKRFHSGSFDPQSGHLHPLKYCLGLAEAAKLAGVQIFENSAVLQLRRGSQVRVKTAQAELVCDFAVLAGNVYLNEFSHKLAPELNKRIMPVGTYIIATEAMEPQRAEALIRQRCAVCDNNFVLDYFRPTADHRMLFGGRVSYSAATPRNLVSSMRQRMLNVFPQLGDLKVIYAWGGFVDISMNRAPDFGRLDHNIYYLQGFSGHGLALTGMAGKLVADSIAGQAERFDLLARVKHYPFPGGKLMRTPALVLGMLYYQIKDLL